MDHILIPYLIAAGLVIWAGYEWAIELGFSRRVHPLVISVLAAIGVAFFVLEASARAQKAQSS